MFDLLCFRPSVVWCGRTCSLRSNCGSSTKSKWTVLWRSLGPCCKTVCKSTQTSQSQESLCELQKLISMFSVWSPKKELVFTVCAKMSRGLNHIHCVVNMRVPAIRYQARPQQDWRADGPQDHSGSTIPSLWQHSRHGLCFGDVCASQVRLGVHGTSVMLGCWSTCCDWVSLFFSDRQTRF